MSLFKIRNGNQMIAEAGIAAGCRFFAGYPITPASSIYKTMIDELPKRGDVAISSPDEISALAFCVGASQRGFKAMTATSGPGFSLMVETLQYAVMTETPLVIALVQRLGPSTGGATQGGQGDVLLTGYSIAGGYTIPVFSPSNPVEAYNLTLHAFNVAEKFRTPVIVMTDKEVGMTSENVDYEKLEKPEIFERKRFDTGSGGEFKTYSFKKRGDVPDFAPVGGEQKVTITGSAHDMAGRLQKNSAETLAVLRHLQEKIAFRSKEIIRLDIDPASGGEAEDPETAVISYGISARTAREAVVNLRKQGKKVSFINLQTLFPIPDTQIVEAVANAKSVVIVEENMRGLYRSQIERILSDKIVLGANDVGKMISPRRIEQTVLAVN